jgi:hypothetical protein
MTSATTLAEIDARIVILELELRDLRTRRKAFAPPGTIPSELVVHTSQLVQAGMGP